MPTKPLCAGLLCEGAIELQSPNFHIFSRLKSRRNRKKRRVPNKGMDGEVSFSEMLQMEIENGAIEVGVGWRKRRVDEAKQREEKRPPRKREHSESHTHYCPKCCKRWITKLHSSSKTRASQIGSLLG